MITKVFGSTDFIGIADSGINELFKPPRRGRPPKADAKKRQRQDFDVTFVTKVFWKEAPAKAPPLDASPSDTNKILNIADILLQATDLRTGQVKVFVEWDDRPLSAASWILLKSLNKDAAQWWNLLKEVRYPLFAEHMFPKLPISGEPRDDRRVTHLSVSFFGWGDQCDLSLYF